MTKIQMPEPAMFNASGVGGVIYPHGYTATQMEAYKDACVREALLEAYRSMQELHMSLMSDATPCVHPAQIASFAANRISALIPKD